MADLTSSQWSLLEWLGIEEFNPYGEFHGIDLNRLVSLGLAKVEVDELEGSKFWAPVSLTDAGRDALSAIATTPPHPPSQPSTPSMKGGEE